MQTRETEDGCNSFFKCEAPSRRGCTRRETIGEPSLAAPIRVSPDSKTKEYLVSRQRQADSRIARRHPSGRPEDMP
jgi:hypothetical protein